MKLKASEWPNMIRVDRALYRLEVGSGGDDHGSCDVEAKTIKVKPSSVAEDLDTLFHEFLHAVEHEYTVKLSHPQVYQLARALSRFVLDNPSIFDSKK